jgi:hypothetical protein
VSKQHQERISLAKKTVSLRPTLSVSLEQKLKRQFGQSSTPSHNLIDFSNFFRIVDNKPLEEFTRVDIDGFIDQQIVNCLSLTTINRKVPCIRLEVGSSQRES